MDWVELPASEDIKNVGTRKQLFLDDEIIETRRWVTPRAGKSAPLLVETDEETEARVASEKSQGTDVSMGIPGHVLVGTQHVYRTQHEPVKHPDNPIVRRDRPWEGASDDLPRVFSGVVHYDAQEAIWKMWYCSLGGAEVGAEKVPSEALKKVGVYTLYATSEDGIHWDKPDLGLVEIDGGTRNNVVFFEDDTRFHFVYPEFVRDPHDAEPGRWRFKGMIKTKPDQTVGVSADGFRWKEIGTFERIGDENIYCLYDRKHSLYVMFTRNLYRKPQAFPQTRAQRTFQIALSKDMLHWSHPRMILVPEPRDPLDGETIHIWPFCYEEIYIGILGIRKTARIGGDIVDNQLVYSRDLLHWHRMGEHRVFIPQGPKGSFDEVSVEGFCVVVLDGEIRFYYDGTSVHEKGQREEIGLATLRRDGFVSLDAPPPQEGIPPESTLLTKPLWSTGSRLVVNAAANGYINAELTDPDGRVIPGFGHTDCEPFTGDSLGHTFTWKGREDISACFPLRIRFRMRDASLYSLSVSA